jgi:hypothetical protein
VGWSSDVVCLPSKAEKRGSTNAQLVVAHTSQTLALLKIHRNCDALSRTTLSVEVGMTMLMSKITTEGKLFEDTVVLSWSCRKKKRASRAFLDVMCGCFFCAPYVLHNKFITTPEPAPLPPHSERISMGITFSQ